MLSSWYFRAYGMWNELFCVWDIKWRNSIGDICSWAAEDDGDWQLLLNNWQLLLNMPIYAQFTFLTVSMSYIRWKSDRTVTTGVIPWNYGHKTVILAVAQFRHHFSHKYMFMMIDSENDSYHIRNVAVEQQLQSYTYFIISIRIELATWNMHVMHDLWYISLAECSIFSKSANICALKQRHP